VGELFEAQVQSDNFDGALFFKQIGGKDEAPVVEPITRAGFKKLLRVAAELSRGDA
jgi:hypothetical protein